MLTPVRSQGESQPMVSVGRSSLYHYRKCYGRGHDTRSGLPVLRLSTAKVSIVDDLGLHDVHLGYHLPVVLLGLFSRFLSPSNQWLHRRR